MHIRSAALWFAFSMLVSGDAIYGHDIKVSGTNGITYDHKGDTYGAFGWVLIKNNEDVNWTCADNCQSLTIAFPAGVPCTTYKLGPANSVYCHGFTGASVPPFFIKYNTTLLDQNNISLEDDPEFIVDDIQVNPVKALLLKTTTGVIALIVSALVLLGIGYRLGKARARKEIAG